VAPLTMIFPTNKKNYQLSKIKNLIPNHIKDNKNGPPCNWDKKKSNLCPNVLLDEPYFLNIVIPLPFQHNYFLFFLCLNFNKIKIFIIKVVYIIYRGYNTINAKC